MKNLILIAILSCLSAVYYAQSPAKFNYQAVARDASGEVIANQNVGVRISILSGSSTGTTEYVEEHAVVTNGFGLFNFKIGEGSNPTGDIATIDWSTDDFFIKVEFDGDGGTNYSDLSTSQLVSVPFSLFANDVLNDDVDDADADPANELQTISMSNDTIFLSDGGSVQLPEGFDGQYSSLTGAPTNVSAFTNDAGYLTSFTEVDGSITNEIQAVSFSNDTLYLSDGGSVYLGSYVNEVNNDNDSLNEIQVLSISNDTVYLTDGGFVQLPEGFDGQYSSLTGAPSNVSAFTNDAGYLTSFTEVDGSITNEIQVVSFSNDTLYLSDGGSVYLGGYTNIANNDNDSTNEVQSISISNDTVYLSDGGFVELPAGFDGQYSSLTGAPTNVSTFTNDAGYLTSFTEVDGSITNEIQAISISNDTIYLSDGGFVKLPAAAGFPNGSTAGNTPYWNGSQWITTSSNIHNNGGNVGIGTSSPDNKLHVEDVVSNHVAIQIENGRSIAGMELETQPATALGEAILNIGVHTNRALVEKGSDPTGMWMRIDSRSGTKTFDWYFEDAGSDTETKIMELNSTGNLTLNGAYTMPNSDGTTGQVLTTNGTGTVSWQSATGGDTDWTVSGTDMYAGVTGNVGIGTSSPGAKLTIGNNIASGGLDNYNEYQVVLYQTASAANAYGMGVRSGTFVVNTDDMIDIDVDGVNAWRFHDSRLESFGSGNSVFVGRNAGMNDDLSDNRNVGVGYGALSANTTGASSVAVGTGALDANTTGGNNVAVGFGAGQSNVTNVGITAVGYQAANNSTVNYTTAVGQKALRLNTTGNSNTAVGASALESNTTGNANTALGFIAGNSNTTGSHNTALGHGALNANTVDSNSTAVGYQALVANTASSNTAVGHNAAVANTTGTKNTVVGAGALAANTTGFQHTTVGYGAGNAGGYTTTVGHLAGSSNTAGYTTAIGDRTLANNTSGNANTAVGGRSMQNNVTGSENVAMGYGAAYSNTAGDYITAIGFQAANSTTGNENTAIGHKALFNNTSGGGNVAVGGGALDNSTTSSGNTAVGTDALLNFTTGANNTAVGIASGLDLGAGTYNLFLGRVTGNSSATYSATNMVCLGYNTAPGGSNTVRLGNSSSTSIGGYAAWSHLSDGRFKRNVQEDVPGLDFIQGLRPVTYEIDIDRLNNFLYGSDNDEGYNQMAREAKSGMVESGFIAQEVESLAKGLGYEFSGITKPESDNQHYSLAYSTFVVPLVKATQEQQVIIEQQQQEIDELREMLNTLMNSK